MFFNRKIPALLGLLASISPISIAISQVALPQQESNCLSCHSGTPATLANVNINEVAGCDYSDADRWGGWGWNQTLSESCPPLSSATVAGGYAHDNSAQASSSQTCDYTDAGLFGGWGWNPVTMQSCAPVASNNQNSSGQTSDQTNTLSGFPACASASSDTNNDGWGWENNATCRVISSTSANNASTCDDPDGDGWGWNGSSSCRVSTGGNSSTANDTSSGTSCIDTQPFGNGWGWDGSASCRINVADNSTTDNSSSQSNDSESNNIEEFSGNRLSQTVLIPRVSAAPAIDGTRGIDEWTNAVSADVAGQTTWIDNLIVREQGNYSDYGPTSRWYAMHDGSFLYILVYNTQENDSNELWQDSANVYQDDSIEIFIDGDNSKLTSFDGRDDYMFALRYDDTMPNFLEWGNRGSRTDLLFTYSTNQAYKSNRDAAIYEIAINLSSAGIFPGDLIGLEIQINEDDDGGDRDAKWSWAERTAEHRAWFDPSAFGTAKLQY